jgi:hypothetical protein
MLIVISLCKMSVICLMPTFGIANSINITQNWKLPRIGMPNIGIKPFRLENPAHTAASELRTSEAS